MKTSESINEIIAALVIAQAQIEAAPKDSVNPHFKSNYADLASIWGACKEALTKNNIAIVQSPTFIDGRLILTTRLFHKSGQWLENELSIKPQQDTAQAIGTCITYARRYALAAMVGVVSDQDDDGHAASHKDDALPPKKSISKPPPPPSPQVPLFNKHNQGHVNRAKELIKNHLPDKDFAELMPRILDKMHDKDTRSSNFIDLAIHQAEADMSKLDNIFAELKIPSADWENVFKAMMDREITEENVKAVYDSIINS